jgi:putative long chain acyl-CoA synthase
MPLVPDLISGPAGRIGAAAQNALEVVRFGGLETDEQPSPYEVFAERPVYRLRRYFPPQRKRANVPAVLLIPPMMLSTEIYDVAPSTSAVSLLQSHGTEPWVIDFGAPEREEGGLERSLTDHVLAVSEAIDLIAEETGREVHIGGYSQGGMFAYQAAAYRRGESIASVIVFGSPVDTRGTLTFGLPEEILTRGASFLAENLFAQRALPAWASRTGFRLMDPAKSLRQRLQFIRQLHDREALLPRERQRRFMEAEGWVAWPGPALAEVIQQFGVHNRLVSGGFVIEDRLVTLADLDCPVLVFYGTNDDIAPPHTVRAVRNAAPRAEVYEAALPAGHFGLVVGSIAVERTWPAVAAWMRWRDGGGEQPEGLERVDDTELPPREPGVGDRLGTGIELAAGAGFGAAQALAGAAVGAGRTLRELVGDAGGQYGRLQRLGRIGARTRISFGLLLSESAEESPEDVALLFEDRGHTRAAVNERIDNIVCGLIELGVRQGEHVGVLMQTRPSALSAVVALNRLGAVAVLMRPDGDPAREAELGKVGRIIADPQNAERTAALTGRPVFVLGGGGGPRRLAAGLVDMERIDPAEVTIPAWYRPNPGLAGELAFVLFTGSGERTRASRISNGRWALSAFGTASSAALSASDTVYSATPVYHPSALLMSIGGAVAGGARLAVAGDFDPATFWDEVRRYGASVVSYTWTMLDEVVEAPPHPGERHHPVRLFIGSGMPPGVWRRASERFAPARVLEFYASTEGDAVLVNLTGQKPGCKGAPLPGSAEVRLARYDMEAGRLIEGSDGFAVPCAKHETGMLLARVERATAQSGAEVLRGVFEAGDAWLQTGDLFRRDVDGDYWLVDHAAAVVRTPEGMVPAGPITDALATIPAVRLAVAYGVAMGEQGPGSERIPVAALTLRDGAAIKPADLDSALGPLGSPGRPQVVRIVERIPVAAWHRPVTGPLAEEGLPEPTRPATAFWWDEAKQGYRPLSAAARKRLLRGG